MMNAFFLNVDILGACNLACPSCPQGNGDRHALPRGLMSIEMFEAILDKAARECVVTGVGLFNWTEPLLHPRIGEFVAAVKARGLACHLSANLNDARHLPAAIAAQPDTLRVSISGFTQPVYGRTHARGDIGRVKENLIALARRLAAGESRVRVTILWHRYRHNEDEENLMREFTARLGFGFETCEAYLMPVERVLERWAEKLPPLPVEELLRTPLHRARPRCEAVRRSPCRLQTRELTIDAAGDVHTCCAVHDPKLSRLGKFTALPLAEIQAAKQKSETCTRCLRAGGHAYATFLWQPRALWLNRLGHARAKVRGWCHGWRHNESVAAEMLEFGVLLAGLLLGGWLGLMLIGRLFGLGGFP